MVDAPLPPACCIAEQCHHGTHGGAVDGEVPEQLRFQGAQLRIQGLEFRIPSGFRV
jgi:hypothetical protein